VADQAEYVDHLREAFLALATVPLAGFDTASYCLRETLDRASRLGSDVLAATVRVRAPRARRGRPAASAADSADVLARELFDAARLYLRSMARLPGDAGIYFTGEMARRLTEMEPADTDLGGQVSADLENLVRELDRLIVTIRSAAGSAIPRGQAREALARSVERLRANGRGVLKNVRETRTRSIDDRRAARTLAAPPDAGNGRRSVAAAAEEERVLAGVQDALGHARILPAKERQELERIARQIRRQLVRTRPRRSASSPKTRASRKGA
jgi:hypothetical protein